MVVVFFQLTISPSDLLALIFKKFMMQKHTITTIHHDEKHDFFFHLVNSATMEINYEDMCILRFGQSQ